MIEFKKVCKQFCGEQVLDNFDLMLDEQSTLFIFGKSGRGKTTILNLLLGLVKPDSGTITGTEHKKMAAVFQEDRLCPTISAKKNIAIACKDVTDEQIIDNLFQVGFSKEDMIKPVNTLSGGMKRRVAIVRCVLSGADILAMDEPFKGLDAATKESCMSYVKSNTENNTLIIVTHDHTEADYIGGKCIRI